MNIIISPAKKMVVCNDDLANKSMSNNLDKTNLIYDTLSNLSYDELKNILCCNDDIAELNFERYKNMNTSNLESNSANLTPAILAYDGIQYKYMSPNTLSDEELDYINNHLKILSGFYGVLRPFDGVVPYRLEMQAKLKVNNSKNLYDFWGDTLYKEVTKDSNVILNLASKEYSKAIEKYLSKDDKLVTCIFGTLKDSKVKVKATEAKMARGLMTRYITKNRIDNIQDIKNFSELDFKYSEEHSTENEFVFIKCI